MYKTQLKKAGLWLQDKKWGGKQNNLDDKNTSKLVYNTETFEELLERSTDIEESIAPYLVYRWYNFKCESFVKSVMASHPLVKLENDEKHKTIDLYIDGLAFDLKNSVYPKGYEIDINEAIEDKRSLIRWLYKNQSTDQRHHKASRLFLVYYDTIENKHNLVKSNCKLIESSVLSYLNSFSIEKLLRLTTKKNEPQYSDVIFIINY